MFTKKQNASKEVPQAKKRKRLSLKELRKSKAGVTLIQVFFVVVIIIALAVFLNPIDLFNKTTRGRVTAAWTTDLANLANNMLVSNDRNKLMYSTRVSNPTAGYDVELNAPPVSSYMPVTSLTIDATRTITYGLNSSVAMATPTGYTLYDYASKTIPAASGLPGLSHAGSQGIAPFINKSVPKVEESVFYGLFNADSTPYGRKVRDLSTSAAKQTTIEHYISKVLGNTATVQLNKTAPDRIVSLNLVDSKALRELIDGQSRFLDQSKYRVYWVSSVATEDEAVTILTGTGTPTLPTGITVMTEEEARDFYRAMIKHLNQDTLVVMPNDKNDVVYSETSDFKLYKFSTAD